MSKWKLAEQGVCAWIRKSCLGKEEGLGRGWHSDILSSPIELEQRPGYLRHFTEPRGAVSQVPGAQHFMRALAAPIGLPRGSAGCTQPLLRSPGAVL